MAVFGTGLLARPVSGFFTPAIKGDGGAVSRLFWLGCGGQLDTASDCQGVARTRCYSIAVSLAFKRI